MSGVCGIVDFAGRPVPASSLTPMIRAAAYRGRDGVETWAGDGVALAFLALNVTPESRREVQPLVHQASGVVLVADLRLDNRDELMAALRPLPAGLPPVGLAEPSDADLLMAAYLAWGEAGIGRLIGDFAFVVWDPRRRVVLAARDAMGMRPLAYRWDGRRLWFASEVQQILAAGVPRRLFEPAIAAHLVGRFEDHHWTPYEGISRIVPGHALVVTAAGDRAARFWDIDPDRRVRFRDERDYALAFRELFEEAVRCRLRSDSPVGLLLSGGLDSGSVASMAGSILHRQGGDPSWFRTYSWAFDELRAADERHISDLIVEAFGFTAIDVPADDAWPLSDYPTGGPTDEGPFMGVYQALIARGLARARADGVAQMLAGNRGDLLLGEMVPDVVGMVVTGRWQAAVRDLQMYRRWRRVSVGTAVKRLLLRPALADVAALPPFDWVRDRLRRSRSRRSPAAGHAQGPAWIRSDLLARAGLHALPTHGLEPPAALRGVARRQRYRMIFSGMQMATLLWNDALHATAGLAFADPWSDRRLAEFVLAAPPWAVHRLSDSKRLGRRAMHGVMPELALAAVTKINPRPLFRRAVEAQATEMITEWLSDPVSARLGFIDPGPLRVHFEEVRRGGPSAPTFWWAVTLEAWLRNHHPA